MRVSEAMGFEARGITLEEFMAIEDNDLQKYIYKNVPIIVGNSIKKVDNQEKLGFYKIDTSVNVNAQGKFYTKTYLTQWIVYNKANKKVKVSKAHSTVMDPFLKEYFSNLDIVKLFINKLTPTLCKKIIEDKIKTIGDILSYHRSYTIKKKNVKLETVGKFMVHGQLSLINSVEDPDNMPDLASINQDIMQTINNIRTCRAFTFKTEDLPNIKERYGKWSKEQSKKYDSLRRPRDEKNGSYIIQEATK